MASNRKTGTTFESELCEILSQNGFWAHNLAQNSAGQPADVIAVRNKTAYLIDCKVCSRNKYSLSRIIHLGDHDPSGIDMTRDIQERMDMFGADVFVKRVALTMEQIETFCPPPNPTKLSDARASSYIREYGHECWELDALEPKVITSLIRNEVTALFWNIAPSRSSLFVIVAFPTKSFGTGWRHTAKNPLATAITAKRGLVRRSPLSSPASGKKTMIYSTSGTTCVLWLNGNICICSNVVLHRRKLAPFFRTALKLRLL